MYMYIYICIYIIPTMNCYPRNGQLRDHGRYYITRLFFFFWREIFTYNNYCLIIYLSYYLLIKHGFQNVSPF